MVPESEFERVNVEGTRKLYEFAREAGVRKFVYTSTTALYGHAISPGVCTWVDEDTPPQPRTVYHRTNLAAEALLEEMASEALPVRVLRMSRCFPEPVPIMAIYRLHRGIDARDVADGHKLALAHEGAPFERFILSGATPFNRDDCAELSTNAEEILREREPELAEAFDRRGWTLPTQIDRVYDSSGGQERLGWKPCWDWREVLAQLDRRSIEVLPPGAQMASKSE